MGYAISNLDELGSGYGFRKIRTSLNITAFGANAIVMPAGTEAFWHYHDEQDELYFVHRGRAKVEVGDPQHPDVHELGEGGMVHVESTTPRRLSNIGDEDLVLIVIGAKDGYVGRDGQLVDMADLERRRSFGQGTI
jgi:mannose-6-phosphate isomerase-like protein (cupin superfamily)